MRQEAMIMKAIRVGIVVLVLGACGARTGRSTTPEERARAATVLICGGTVRDVAAELEMSDDDARRLVRSTIRELMRRLHRGP
jgi:hypothetical protein